MPVEASYAGDTEQPPVAGTTVTFGIARAIARRDEMQRSGLRRDSMIRISGKEDHDKESF